jgi:uncharacterized protein YhdP
MPANLSVPDMNVVIRGLSRGGQPMGALSFAVRNGPQGLQAGPIEGQFAGLRFLPEHDNRVRWDDTVTAIDWRLGFVDLAETLARFEYEPVLETSGGEIEAELSWPGGPTDFGLAAAQGTLHLAARDGRFLEAPTGAGGALRVVGILNLAEIVSRLSLSHMFESGIPFRTLETDVALRDGVLDVGLLEVVGASSRFQFAGSSAIEAQTLSGELVVTLPVANNLPWVAALAAGPAVAAGVFVVSRVFEKQVDQLSSAVYQVGGSWEEPEVNLSRIFDVAEDPPVSRTTASRTTGSRTTDSPATESGPDDSDSRDQTPAELKATEVATDAEGADSPAVVPDEGEAQRR